MVVPHVACYYEYQSHFRIKTVTKDQSFGAGFIIIIPCEKLKVTEEIQSHFLDIRNNKLVLFALVYQDFG